MKTLLSKDVMDSNKAILNLFEYAGRSIACHIDMDSDSSFFYCTRAGFSIKKLVNATGHLSLRKEYIFATSRILAAKAVFKNSPDAFVDVCYENYKHTSIGTALACLIPQEILKDISIRSLSNSGNIDLDHSFDSDYFREILFGESHVGDKLRSHLYDQYKIYLNYINSITLKSKSKNIVLIDSGWRGTTQYLLQLAFPMFNFKGLYIGIDNPISENTGKNSQAVLFCKKRCKAILEHHHLVEDILECGVASAHYLTDQLNSIFLNGCINVRSLDDILFDESLFKPHFNEICKKISHGNKEAFHVYIGNTINAINSLESKILSPDKSTVYEKSFNSGIRTADFGKTEARFPVITESYSPKLRNTEDRILQSLWKQGQIALEYPSEHAIVETTTTMEIPTQTVAVITRTKNRALLLKRAMASVVSQSYHNLIWVIINDGGDEHSVNEVLSACPLPAERIVLIHNKKSCGMEAASNKAIRSVDSDLIVIHDDDDAWEPEFLTKSIIHLNACSKEAPNSNINGVITHAWRVSEYLYKDYAQTIEKTTYNEWINYISFEHMAKENLFAPIQFVFDRKIYDKVGGYNESLPVLGDWDFNLKFLMEAEIVVLPEKLAYYYHRDHQDKGAYSNSVIGGRDKHALYGTILRNNAVRGSLQSPLNSIVTAALIKR